MAKTKTTFTRDEAIKAGKGELWDMAKETVDARKLADKQVKSGEIDAVLGSPYTTRPEEQALLEAGGIGPVYGGKLASGTEFTGFRDYGGERSFAVAREQEKQEERAAVLGARIKAKNVIDSQQTSMAYTPQQERELERLHNARATAEAKVATGEWTPQDLEQAEEQITSQIKAILPQPIKKGPTPTDIFMQNQVQDPITGVRVYQDKNGKWNEVPGQPDHATRLKYWELAGQQLKVVGKDKDGKPVEEPLNAAEQSAWVANAMRTSVQIGAATGGMQTTEQLPPEERSAADELVAMGMSEERMQQALEAEGSYGAVLRRVLEDKPAEEKTATEDKAEKEAFLKSKKPPNPYGRPIRQPSLDELRGFGGRGY